MIFRRTAKKLAESFLRLAGGDPRRMAGNTLVLAYHNVVPDEASGRGDQSLHLPWSRFLRQLDLIQEHCEVRPLAAILAEGPFTGGPHVGLTFDDAYRGAVELALPELHRRGLASTLFVAPGLLGARSFWWDELSLEGKGLPEDLREQALEALAGRYEQIRTRLPARAAVALPEWYACATEAQVKALGSLPTVTLGAHSWSHPNLARLGGAELATELSRPLEWLGTVAVPSLPALAYPYGIHSSAVETAAKAAGYAAALRVEGGWFAPPVGHPWAIPRFNVPAGLSDDGLMIRLSGRI